LILLEGYAPKRFNSFKLHKWTAWKALEYGLEALVSPNEM
jgi:hypothetical protein